LVTDTRYPERPIDDVIQCEITKGNIFEISFVDNEFGVMVVKYEAIDDVNAKKIVNKINYIIICDIIFEDF
jgi:hypothetical protein